MPKAYNIQKEKWKKPEDPYLPSDKLKGTTSVMGSTGVGKSTFINNVLLAVGLDPQAPVDDSYTPVPCTNTVAHYVANLPPTLSQHHVSDIQNRRLVLVDTPGFGHISFSDAEVLRRIAVWLAASYGAGVKVAGVVYLQAIVPERITEDNASGLEIFAGRSPFPELSLRLRGGNSFLSGPQRAAVVRLENTPSSALNLVREIVNNMPRPNSRAGGIVLRLQHQIVDKKKTYDKTDAGLAAKPRAETPLAKAATAFRSFIRGF